MNEKLFHSENDLKKYVLKNSATCCRFQYCLNKFFLACACEIWKFNDLLNFKLCSNDDDLIKNVDFRNERVEWLKKNCDSRDCSVYFFVFRLTKVRKVTMIFFFRLIFFVVIRNKNVIHDIFIQTKKRFVQKCCENK